MDIRNALIVGGDQGIGFELALRLAEQGITVAITASTRNRARKARVALIERSRNPNIDVFVYDPGSLKQTKRFITAVEEQYRSLQLLVHADVTTSWHFRPGVSGYAYHWTYNVLNPYFLVRKLMPLLQRSGQASLLMLSGESHRDAQIISRPKPYLRPFLFGRGKGVAALSRLMLTYYFSQWSTYQQVTANAFCSGELAPGRKKREKTWLVRQADYLFTEVLPEAFYGMTGSYHLLDHSIESSPIAQREGVRFKLVKGLDYVLSLPTVRLEAELPATESIERELKR